VGHVQHVLQAAQLLPAGIVNFETADWEQALTHKAGKQAVNSSSTHTGQPAPAPMPVDGTAPPSDGAQGDDGASDVHLQGDEHAAPHRRDDNHDLETAREHKKCHVCVHTRYCLRVHF
jgi:hypothetical protein